MIVKLNSETNKLEVVIEKKDICRTCSVIYRCPKILDYLDEVSYISTKNKEPYSNCWFWEPFDDKEKENTVIDRSKLWMLL